MSRRTRWILLAVMLLVAALLSALYWLSRPGRVPALLLDRIGATLGLEISAKGTAEYRLRGTPMLLLRDIVAREPGAATPLLRAGRVYLTLPWTTIRARGADLTINRVELDDAQLDLPALQHWLATRPPSAETRIPTLTDGLRVTNGSIVNGDATSGGSISNGNATSGGWRIDGIDAELRSLYPDRPLQARLRGRYIDAPLAVPFDFSIALRSPRALAGGDRTGVGINGRITIEHGEWRMPAQLAVSGPVRWRSGRLTVKPARIGLDARYESGDTRLPFALGLHGPLRFGQATWTLAPAGVALRGPGMVPTVDAHGVLALGLRLVLQLDGSIAQWPDAWPALPPPIGQSKSPLPFALRYVGEPGLSDVAGLQLRRDASVFDGRFRLPAVLDWINATAEGSPLPPIDGTLNTPTLQISGATLQGVEIEFDGDESPAPLP